MSNLIQKIKNEVKDNYINISIVRNLNKKDKYFILSFSFLVLGIFMFIIASVTGSEELQTARKSIGSVCFALWFIILPMMDSDRKSDIAIEFSKYLPILLLSAIDIQYWVVSCNSEFETVSKSV